jgi:Dolichyl-phosphate-mannose-protein mannosyltransferase
VPAVSSKADAATSPSRQSRFIGCLAAIAVVAIGIRCFYVLQLTDGIPLGLDSTWYGLESGLINSGAGFIDPGTLYRLGRSVPTAAWPPLYPGYLSVVTRFVGDTSATLRLAGCLPALVVIILTAVLARRVFQDDRIALTAAAIVAVSPLVVATDTSLMSESLSVACVMVVLLLAQRLARVRGVRDLALVGIAGGIGALVRTDVAIVAVVATSLVLVSRRVSWMRLLGSVAIVCLVMMVVVAPWSIRNAVRVGTPSISSVSVATAVAGANCDTTYGRGRLGYWDFDCIDNQDRLPDNEVSWSNSTLRKGLKFAATHAYRAPLVVGARLARTYGLWDPRKLADEEAGETRKSSWQLFGWVFDAFVIGLAAVGVIRLRRSWRRIAILVAPLGAVAVTATITYGNQRFRVPAEPALAIFAAWTICTSVSRARSPVPRET